MTIGLCRNSKLFNIMCSFAVRANKYSDNKYDNGTVIIMQNDSDLSTKYVSSENQIEQTKPVYF